MVKIVEIQKQNNLPKIKSLKTFKKCITKIQNSDNAVEVFNTCFKPLNQHVENVYMISLDNSNNIICLHHIAKLSQNYCCFPIREIVQNALICGAQKIIIAHNHPSNAHVSIDDIRATKKLECTCKTVELELLDSIVLKQNSESILNMGE